MTKKSSEATNQTLELIKRLSLSIGVSGYSGPNNVHQVITAEMTPYADRVERDRMGSVIGLKEGDQAKPKTQNPKPKSKIQNPKSCWPPTWMKLGPS